MTENEERLLEKLDELANDPEVDMYSVATLNSYFEECGNTIRVLLEKIQQYRAIGTVEQINRALDLGSEVHIKLKKYQKIGTVEECRTAVERMKPKKVAYQGEHKKCPACGSFHVFGRHCTECGQAVDYD